MYQNNKDEILESGLKQMREVCEKQSRQIEILEADRRDLQSEVDYFKAKVKEYEDHIKSLGKPTELDAMNIAMEDLS